MASYAWGGQRNGYIDASALQMVNGILLRADAASAYAAMARAFEARFGKKLEASEGYRDYATQVYWKEWWTDRGKPGNAASPGGSIHGWGLAVDIDLAPGGVALTQEEVEWLHTVGREYGFNWESTGKPTGEPWHLDFNLPVTANIAAEGATAVLEAVRKGKMKVLIQFADAGTIILWDLRDGKDGRRAIHVQNVLDAQRLIGVFGPVARFDSQAEWEIIRQRYELGN